jgi:hypothetical protein
MGQCGNCSALAKVIQKQQAEIQKLKQLIAGAKAVCDQIATESSRVMAQHGSPYKYNLAKGAKDAALNIERRLKL